MESNRPNSFPHWNARQVISATILVVAVFLGFWLLFRFHMVLVILFASIVLGTALSPFVGWFVSHGWNRPSGIAVTYTVLLGILVIFLLLVVPIIVQQTMDLAVSLPEMYGGLRSALLHSNSIIIWNIGIRLPENLNLILNAISMKNAPLETAANFVGISSIFLSGLLVVGEVFLLATFWILESERTLRATLLLAPLHWRAQMKDLWQAIEARLAAFVRGQLILMLSIGAMAFIAYLTIGLPNALVLALIAGVLEAVPVLGPMLGAIPALLVAYSINPLLVVWVLVAAGLIQTIENYFLVPRVMGASVGVNPITALLVLAAFGSLLGLPGAFLAIPIAAVIQVLVDRFVLSKNHTVESDLSGRDLTSVLRYEAQNLIGDVRKQLRKKDERSSDGSDKIEDAIETLAGELDQLLNQEVSENNS